ncbi:hypothetical protein GF373_03620 [bacterium]|nr:hypothetical protein [bacterium]
MSEMDKEPQKLKDFLDNVMDTKIDPELENNMERSLQRFRENLPNHPAFQSKNRWILLFERFLGSRPLQFAWTTAAAVLLMAFSGWILLGQSQPTWAKVKWHFQTLSFFHASVYFKEHPLAETTQFDVWMGKGGKVRLHFGNQVIFANPQGIQQTFDIIYREAVQPHKDGAKIIQQLHAIDTFSLEHVINSLAGDISHLQAEPSLIEGVAEDLKIFLLNNPQNEEWMRIWTLRESLLPILLRRWNPTTRESIEIVFSYLDQQPKSFFEPEAFEAILRDSSKGPEDLLYSFFKDPSGLTVIPE